jgi:hypothetical protein
VKIGAGPSIQLANMKVYKPTRKVTKMSTEKTYSFGQFNLSPAEKLLIATSIARGQGISTHSVPVAPPPREYTRGFGSDAPARVGGRPDDKEFSGAQIKFETYDDRPEPSNDKNLPAGGGESADDLEEEAGRHLAEADDPGEDHDAKVQLAADCLRRAQALKSGSSAHSFSFAPLRKFTS